MRQYILTVRDEALGHMFAMPPGCDIRPIATESIDEANRRKAVAEADLAEAKLAVVRGEVASAGKQTGPTIVNVNVFGKGYTATVDSAFAELLLSEIKGLSHHQQADVVAISKRLSPIVDASVLSSAIWGRRYRIFVRGKHIVFVRHGEFGSDAWPRGW